MEKIYDVLIIGSGPAGLTAGIYSVRSGLSTLMISGKQPGGQLTQTTMVENFPGFFEGVMGPVLMENMRKQAIRLGAVEKNGIVEKVDFSQRPFKVWVNEELYQGKSVIIATGTETKWLGIPSEQKFIGHGVATCATCDGFFYKDKKVIVVGGGDTALEEAIFLTRFACEVIVIHRRDKLKASKAMQDTAFANKKIKFIWNSTVEEIVGEEKVTGIKIREIGGSGLPSLKATADQGKVREIETEGVFVAIGHIPQTEIFKGQVEIDDKGFVIIDQKLKTEEREKNKYKMMTSVGGVFAAGDIHDSIYKQAITAAGFGCMAALEVEKWLQKNN